MKEYVSTLRRTFISHFVSIKHIVIRMGHISSHFNPWEQGVFPNDTIFKALFGRQPNTLYLFFISWWNNDLLFGQDKVREMLEKDYEGYQLV